MSTTTGKQVRVFVSHSHDDNAACQPLLAALTAMGVDYWFDTERLDAGTDLSTRIQAEISSRNYFIRVCSASIQANPYWVDLETNAFRMSQAEASRAGQPRSRVLIPFILDTTYTIQPFEQAVLYINTAQSPVSTWVEQLRRALGVGATGGKSSPSHRAPTRVVDWRYGAGDHTTISDASDASAAAQPGESILIRRGVYTESLTIDKPLELVGDGDRDDVTIEVSDANVILWSAANGLISNLTLRQRGGNYYCVAISQGSPDLEECDISSQGNACVSIYGEGARPRVRRNHIHDSKGTGVFVYEHGQGLIEDNDIAANVFMGIQIQTGSAPTLRQNRIHDNLSDGVLVVADGQGLFEENDIFANAVAGIEIREGGKSTVRRNRINRNTHQAIWVHDNGGGTFEQNDLRDNNGGAWFIAEGDEANVTRRDNQE